VLVSPASTSSPKRASRSLACSRSRSPLSRRPAGSRLSDSITAGAELVLEGHASVLRAVVARLLDEAEPGEARSIEPRAAIGLRRYGAVELVLGLTAGV
jgi:hypothetical protein